MMNNLFSTFDPSTYISSTFTLLNMDFSLNWTSMFIIMLMFPLYFWLLSNTLSFIIKFVINLIYKEFYIIINKKKNNNFNIFFIAILIFILINNFISLFPYIFNVTSHLSINLSLAVPLWLSLMLFGWIKKTNHMFTHLVPQGTPNILIPFMILIESISNMIRPITLMIRLTANMIAGHLLLTLLGNSIPKLNFYFISFMLIIQMILLTLESAVALIQAYVFSILITLYVSEV